MHFKINLAASILVMIAKLPQLENVHLFHFFSSSLSVMVYVTIVKTINLPLPKLHGNDIINFVTPSVIQSLKPVPILSTTATYSTLL